MMNQTQANRLEFWTLFNDVIAERGKPFNIRKASTDHWYDVSVGISGAHISITLVNKEKAVGVEFYILDDKALFDRRKEHKSEIEEAMGLKLDWQRLDNKKAGRILYKINGLNFDDHSNYHALMNQIIDCVLQFKAVFPKYLQ